VIADACSIEGGSGACRQIPPGVATSRRGRYEVAPPQVEHAASSPGATAIIRPPSDVLAQSVCRTSLADGGLNRPWGRPELF
jgi:hypothetical protein